MDLPVGILAFCDDLLLMADSLHDAQRLLAHVDLFLSLHGVNLQPAKSVWLKVGDWRPGERLVLRRGDVEVPLRLAAADEGTRYLGVWLPVSYTHLRAHET